MRALALPIHRGLADASRLPLLVRDEGRLHAAELAFLLLVGVVQLAYVIYVVQMPDWSSVMVVTVVSLVTATSYAALLSFTVLAPADSEVIALLDLTDVLADGRASGWCFIMLCIASLLSYFSGRFGVRWRRKVGSA